MLGSNLPAVLIWIAAELFKDCGVPEPLATAAGLLGSVTSNLVASPGPSALTGPFVRGDAATVAANLAALAAKSPDLEGLYRSLGVRLADQLREGRILSEMTWQTLIETLK